MRNFVTGLIVASFLIAPLTPAQAQSSLLDEAERDGASVPDVLLDEVLAYYPDLPIKMSGPASAFSATTGGRDIDGQAVFARFKGLNDRSFIDTPYRDSDIPREMFFTDDLGKTYIANFYYGQERAPAGTHNLIVSITFQIYEFDCDGWRSFREAVAASEDLPSDERNYLNRINLVELKTRNDGVNLLYQEGFRIKTPKSIICTAAALSRIK